MAQEYEVIAVEAGVPAFGGFGLLAPLLVKGYDRRG